MWGRTGGFVFGDGEGVVQFFGVCNAGVNLTVEVATTGWKPSTTEVTGREIVAPPKQRWNSTGSSSSLLFSVLKKQLFSHC